MSFPYVRISLPIAGVTFGDRQKIIRDIANGDTLRLVVEPDNKYDAEAIRVVTCYGEEVGYIPAKFTLKHELFDLLQDAKEFFLCTADRKRGGGEGRSYGLDVTIERVKIFFE